MIHEDDPWIRRWANRFKARGYRSPVAHRMAYLLWRDGFHCYWCGRLLDVDVWAPKLRTRNSITIDHVRPQSRGGPNSLGNYALACRSCNSIKGDLPADEAIFVIRNSYVLRRFPRVIRRVNSPSRTHATPVPTRYLT